MTVLEALAVLEAAVMDCKRREIRTPVLKAALDLCRTRSETAVIVRYFPGIRISVRELIGKEMDALARMFHTTHDLKTKVELERLAEEYRKLGEPWVFVETELAHVRLRKTRIC